MLESKSFLFLGDKLDLGNQEELRLFDSCILKRANQEQIDSIKRIIEGYFDNNRSRFNLYEYDVIKESKVSRSLKTLTPDEWSYWVVEHEEDSNAPWQRLQMVFGLSDLDLTLLLDSHLNPDIKIKNVMIPGIRFSELLLVNYFHDHDLFDTQLKTINLENTVELADISNDLKLFLNKSEQYDFIIKALKDFAKLWEISAQSPFKILGYFSILESLLTTYSRERTTDGSISFQLRMKIKLLNEFFHEPVIPSEYDKSFGETKLETIIEKLYKYRNNIAHGNYSDFERELKIFKAIQKDLHLFLRMILKRVLRVAIKNPSFIANLKEC